jgi:hypothetical protein
MAKTVIAIPTELHKELSVHAAKTGQHKGAFAVMAIRAALDSAKKSKKAAK